MTPTPTLVAILKIDECMIIFPCCFLALGGEFDREEVPAEVCEGRAEEATVVVTDPWVGVGFGGRDNLALGIDGGHISVAEAKSPFVGSIGSRRERFNLFCTHCVTFALGKVSKTVNSCESRPPMTVKLNYWRRTGAVHVIIQGGP
jgi:hypothetical protein